MFLNRLLLRCLALGLLCLAALGGVPAAHAQDHITERSWLEDPSGRMTWEQARRLVTQPFTGTLNRGYGAGVLWLRLRIDPRAHGAEAMPSVSTTSVATPADPLVLRIRPVYLDDIQVFDPLAAGGKVGLVGDRHHPRLNLVQGADFLLPIARGDAPRDIWLRLKSTSTRQIHASVIPRGEVESVTMRQDLVASLYIGVVLTLFLWAFISRVLHHERVMGAFALMQLTACLYGLSSFGILRVFWPLAWSAEALNLLGSVFSLLVVGGGIWFHIRFLREFRPARWAMGLLYGALALAAVNLLLLAFGLEIMALQSNMVSILLAPPICLACALTGRAWAASDALTSPALSRPVLVVFYIGLITIFFLASTTGLGLVQATEWTIYVSQLHTLVSSVLLMLMLQYRAFIQAQQRQKALLELEKSSLQVHHERRLREEQERLLAMLAHEIKTPLATMHMRLDAESKGGREIRRAMRDMNSVIDRCLQTLQLGDGHLMPQVRLHDVVVAVKDAVDACSEPERVQVQLPAELPMATDPQILFIVLSNLLENACKYSAPQTPIQLQCSVVENAQRHPLMRLELRNLPGAAGWPDAALVFDKYYRSPQARRRSGTGLGLYLVQCLTHTLGGQIRYQPTATEIRFVLKLPLHTSV